MNRPLLFRDRILKCCVRISPRILTTDPHPRPPLPTQAPSRSRVSSPSEPGKLGHLRTINGCSCGAWSRGDSDRTRLSALCYAIASAHCAQRVSLPSAELELMIRVSPRPQIFGGKPSVSVCGSQEFLRICVRRRMRPPSAHLCRRPPWQSARCG